MRFIWLARAVGICICCCEQSTCHSYIGLMPDLQMRQAAVTNFGLRTYADILGPGPEVDAGKLDAALEALTAQRSASGSQEGATPGGRPSSGETVSDSTTAAVAAGDAAAANDSAAADLPFGLLPAADMPAGTADMLATPTLGQDALLAVCGPAASPPLLLPASAAAPTTLGEQQA